MVEGQRQQQQVGQQQQQQNQAEAESLGHSGTDVSGSGAAGREGRQAERVDRQLGGQADSLVRQTGRADRDVVSRQVDRLAGKEEEEEGLQGCRQRLSWLVG